MLLLLLLLIELINLKFIPYEETIFLIPLPWMQSMIISFIELTCLLGVP